MPDAGASRARGAWPGCPTLVACANDDPHTPSSPSSPNRHSRAIIRCPQLRKIAPEYYDTLHHHTSYTWVLWKFITDPAIGPWARIKRNARAGHLDQGMSPAATGKPVVAGMAKGCAKGDAQRAVSRED